MRPDFVIGGRFAFLTPEKVVMLESVVGLNPLPAGGHALRYQIGSEAVEVFFVYFQDLSLVLGILTGFRNMGNMGLNWSRASEGIGSCATISGPAKRFGLSAAGRLTGWPSRLEMSDRPCAAARSAMVASAKLVLVWRMAGGVRNILSASPTHPGHSGSEATHSNTVPQSRQRYSRVVIARHWQEFATRHSLDLDRILAVCHGRRS